MSQSSSTQDGRDRGQAQSPRSHRRKRKVLSCEQCRCSKLKCDRKQPCGACMRRGCQLSCSFLTTPSVVTGSINDHPTSNPSSSNVPPRNTFAAPLPPLRQPVACLDDRPERPGPDGIQDSQDSRWEAVLQRPFPEHDPVAVTDTLSPFSIGPSISLQDIIDILPSRTICDCLVSHFFNHISALFPILHGPTFQKQYVAFMQQPYEVDLSWLALLFSMCSLTLNTMEPSDPRLADLWPKRSHFKEQEAVTMSRRLQQTAMVCLIQDQFFIRHKLSTFEALLMVIYNLSHNESVDQGWALLGMALNIGIALRCNVDSQGLNHLETERRRRCWVGILTLHTYQAILFRDIDMSFLLDIKTTMPADVNDADITQEGVSRPSSAPTQMSVMMFKVRLFRISTQICHHISGPSRLEVEPLNKFDATIAAEQQRWDSTYLVDGAPNILDSSYAYWCILQTYAHQLYLLLHRPFRHSRSPHFLTTSRERCIASSAALMDIHRQIYEVPLLRPYLWLLRGVTSLKALHAAVALNSCLLDMPSSFELGLYREKLNKLVLRMEDLSRRSAICLKAHRILLQLQTQFGAENQQLPNSGTRFEGTIEDWTDMREWFGADLFNWVRYAICCLFTLD
ncbi:unnamed protein product [Penicillium nalgiovense]|uniref:Zn(2)-C6 fungal-type domain-containing protein n=1 Tax=Penicillium nalgiovense TaxID=60175 RepID=A0A9W4HA61_PENNA|nr:unnamed protein product [Penicillium nalgiovense]CAG7954835.1 unnamed protein product [Penicillium nalgiovense]CAG7958652.1 unnamed protein product [Penicillium nalgiovense]CAG7970993.1 unnamed protein product [Penicillium nalgiovense]CAG7985409.1 unnamed protein product [Penicillium nalgiovense]